MKGAHMAQLEKIIFSVNSSKINEPPASGAAERISKTFGLLS